MKFPTWHHKTIALVVMVTFLALIQGYSAPAPASPAKENTGKTVETADGDVPGYFEAADNDAQAVVKKARKFPWLIVALGAVAVSVAVCFLAVKKAKCTLTVTLDAGSTGTPAATARYKKGEEVHFSYSAKQGYSDLQVMLDGSPAAASGTIVMDRDHDIAVSTVGTVGRTTLQLSSTPAGAKIYLDKVDSGYITPHTFIYPASTTKTVLLRHHCGYQDWTREVAVYLGQETVVNASLQPSIREDFDIALSPCWLPRNPSAWRVGSGVLGVVNSTRAYEFALYQYALPADFVITVKQRFVQGTRSGTMGVIFSTTADMGHNQGFEFSITPSREYIIYKNKNYDHYNDEGPWKWIKKDSPCPQLNPGKADWNTVRIVKVGSNFTLYVNGQFVFSFVNDEYDLRYVSLGIFDNDMSVTYDSILLTPTTSGDSVPGLPVSEIPAPAGKRGGDR